MISNFLFLISEDTTPPTISNCPSDIVLEIAFGQTGHTVTWTEPTASDLGEVMLVAISHAPGSFFSIGETMVEYQFEDNAGNSAICTFRVVVRSGTGLFQMNLTFIALHSPKLQSV